MLSEDQMFFINRLCETQNLCLNGFVKFLKSLIYDFLIPSVNKDTIVHHTYEELVENAPSSSSSRSSSRSAALSQIMIT